MLGGINNIIYVLFKNMINARVVFSDSLIRYALIKKTGAEMLFFNIKGKLKFIQYDKSNRKIKKQAKNQNEITIKKIMVCFRRKKRIHCKLKILVQK